MTKMPENRDQGIFFNGSVKKRIVAVFLRQGRIQPRATHAARHHSHYLKRNKEDEERVRGKVTSPKTNQRERGARERERGFLNHIN